MKTRKRDTIPMRFGALDVGVVSDTLIEVEIQNLRVGRRRGLLTGTLSTANDGEWRTDEVQVMEPAETPYPMHVPEQAMQMLSDLILEAIRQWVQEHPEALSSARLNALKHKVRDSERKTQRLHKRRLELDEQIAQQAVDHQALLTQLIELSAQVHQAQAQTWNQTPTVSEAGLGLGALD